MARFRTLFGCEGKTWDGLDEIDPLAKLTVEQVRAVANSYLQNRDLPTADKNQRLTAELNRQRYYQERNTQAIKSHHQDKNTALR